MRESACRICVREWATGQGRGEERRGKGGEREERGGSTSWWDESGLAVLTQLTVEWIGPWSGAEALRRRSEEVLYRICQICSMVWIPWTQTMGVEVGARERREAGSHWLWCHYLILIFNNVLLWWCFPNVSVAVVVNNVEWDQSSAWGFWGSLWCHWFWHVSFYSPAEVWYSLKQERKKNC